MQAQQIQESNDRAIQAWDTEIAKFEALVAELAAMNHPDRLSGLGRASSKPTENQQATNHEK